eukprot:SAG31_NODE_8685_length_1406_cov_1.308340_2_plen_133_part_00
MKVSPCRCASAARVSSRDTPPPPLSERPPNAVNITVYGLRPYNLTGDLVNKDTADANGDVFFFLGDRLLIPMACRHDPSWMMCRGQELLDHDSVYTKYTVEVDGTFGGCPMGDAHCTKCAATAPRLRACSQA